VQRAVLARELSSEGDLLIVANPCFGLDFAAVAEIRARIVQARNRGAAVLLVSEDLDEILQLSDRIVVMFDGRLALETDAAHADVGEIGRAMAGRADGAVFHSPPPSYGQGYRMCPSIAKRKASSHPARLSLLRKDVVVSG
jgi:ABC-type Mn2+/Zn2+ transport system ATPase subunit